MMRLLLSWVFGGYETREGKGPRINDLAYKKNGSWNALGCSSKYVI